MTVFVSKNIAKHVIVRFKYFVKLEMCHTSVCAQPGGGETQVAQMEQQLYTAVSSTSSWLDGVENNVFSGSVLLAENADTQLEKQEVQSA